MKQTRARTGLEVLRNSIAKNEQSPMSEAMSLRTVAADTGTATIEGIPSERFYNPMQRVHGGFAATLIDTALGSAVFTMVEPGREFGTIELKISYVRRIVAETGPLSCTANVLHAGRTLLTAEAKVVDKAGLLYAHGTGTFMIYPKQDPKVS